MCILVTLYLFLHPPVQTKRASSHLSQGSIRTCALSLTITKQRWRLKNLSLKVFKTESVMHKVHLPMWGPHWGEVLRGSTSTSALSLTITHQRRRRRSVPWASKTWTCHLGGFKPLLLLTTIYYYRMVDHDDHKHNIVVLYCPDIYILMFIIIMCIVWSHDCHLARVPNPCF